MTRRFRLVVSGSCAVLSVVLCLMYGGHVRAEAERERVEALERYGGELTTLVVATERIEAGESVSRVNVTEREWLVEMAPEEAVTRMDEVLGSEVSVPVAAGAPLTELNFRSEVGAIEVPEDRVALSVPVDDDLGVPPGTRVGESLAAYEAGVDGVQLLSDDVRVLVAPQSATGGLSTGSITVAVAPEEVARLLAASDEGSLRLALPGEGALASSESAQEAPTSVPPESEATEEPAAGSGEGGEAS